MSDVELVSKARIEEYLKGTPAESKQFNFLVGEWDTKLERFDRLGNVVMEAPGRWHGKWLHDGRIFFDEFHSYTPGGSTQVSYMSTLRTFDPTTKQWQMTFLVAHQAPVLSRFSGESVDGEMHLCGEGKTTDGTKFLSKVRFYDIAASGFTWADQMSFDGGANWFPLSRITARLASSIQNA